MRHFRQFWQFIKNLFGKPRFTPGTVETSAEVEMETERKRGTRGL